MRHTDIADCSWSRFNRRLVLLLALTLVTAETVAAPEFGTGTWICNAARWSFDPAGSLVVDSAPANRASSVPLERIGFRSIGHFQIADGEFAITLERTIATDASPADHALLGDLADIRALRFSRYTVRSEAGRVVLTETFRSFNGREKPQRSRIECART